MSRVARLLAALVVFTGCTTQAPSPEANAPPFGWIEGCWQTASGTTKETWTRGADTLLFGHSVRMDGTAVAFFETLRLEISPGTSAGRFIASPRGGEAIAFDLVDQSNEAAVFENADHDFPQRIRYARDGDDLIAEISRIDGSGSRVWRYSACDP